MTGGRGDDHQYQAKVSTVLPGGESGTHVKGQRTSSGQRLAVECYKWTTSVIKEFIEDEDWYSFKDAPDRGWAVWTNPIWLG